jgi:hypothetical protein
MIAIQKQQACPLSEGASVLENDLTVYLTDRGFCPSKKPGVFTRGSRLGSLTSMSPSNWLTELRLTVREKASGCWVELALQVNTTGQWVREKERRFFDVEIAAAMARAQGKEVDASEVDAIERRVVESIPKWVRSLYEKERRDWADWRNMTPKEGVITLGLLGVVALEPWIPGAIWVGVGGFVAFRLSKSI